jgi:monoamine oxidase
VSRSPLFARLRRTLSLALHAERQNLPTAELVESFSDQAAQARRAQRRLDRRRFLALSAALGVSSLAPRAAAQPAERRRGGGSARIAIIGAGIAGLTCAYRLEQAGQRVTLFDSWNRIGGRMFTSRDRWRDGQHAELGGEFIDTDHEALQVLALELGLTLDPILELPGSGITQDTWFFDGRAVSDAEVVSAFRAVAPQLALDAASEEDEDEFTRLDELSLEGYLDSLAELAPMLRQLLEAAYVSEYGRELAEQSTWNLLWLIDAEEPDPFHVYGDSDEAFRLRGGSDRLTTALFEQLVSPVLLEHQLVRVRERGDGSLRLSFERGTRGTREEVFDLVVFALPFTRLRQVQLDVRLPANKRQIIAELGMGTNAKLMAQFDERIWRTQHQASGAVTTGPAATHTGLQQLWDTARSQRGEAGLLTVYTGGVTGERLGRGSAEGQLLARLPLIDRIFPGTADAYLRGSAVRMHWPSVEHTLGSYSCYLPGQASFSGLEGESVGRLHFCGEHTSVDFQGFMNGGAESGERVAAELIERLRLSATAP